MSWWSINIDTITEPAAKAIYDLDETFVGTANYMGVAWYWSYEYRHVLRMASFHQRKRVHHAMLAARLPLNGDSPAHNAVICRFFPSSGY